MGVSKKNLDHLFLKIFDSILVFLKQIPDLKKKSMKLNQN